MTINWQAVFDQMSQSQRRHGATVAARLSSEKKRVTGELLSDQQFYQTAVWYGQQIDEDSK